MYALIGPSLPTVPLSCADLCTVDGGCIMTDWYLYHGCCAYATSRAHGRIQEFAKGGVELD